MKGRIGVKLINLGSIRGDAWNKMGEDESKYCTIIHRSGGE